MSLFPNNLLPTILAPACASAVMLVFGGAWSLALSASELPVALPALVRRTMADHFRGRVPPRQTSAAAAVESGRARGVFVTLSREGKRRACWGSVFPSPQNVRLATRAATLGALTRDYRQPPVRAWEWPGLDVQVTVVERLEPLYGTGVPALNPYRDGLFIRAGGRTAAILPGEAETAHHQLVMARLKAGIAPHQRVERYRMVTRVYR